ncbi:MAG: restriction endonuclease subunit S, partial [Acidimicrobiales bacterium]
RTVRLGDVTDINPVKVKPAEPTGRVEYIDIASVSTRRVDSTLVTTWSEAPGRARRGVRDGDVIFSTVRPNRRSFALLVAPSAECVVSTGFAVIRAGEEIGTSAVAAIADSLDFSDYLTSMTEGSAYPAVSAAAVAAYNVALPPAEVIRDYEDRTMPLRRRAAQADLESSLLAELRDALLPELLSGRLRVPVAAELVEAAT